MKSKSRSVVGTGRLWIDRLERVSMDSILSNLVVALRLGELMMVEELTWQAIGTYAVFFGLGFSCIALVLAKAVKAWKDALK